MGLLQSGTTGGSTYSGDLPEPLDHCLYADNYGQCSGDSSLYWNEYACRCLTRLYYDMCHYTCPEEFIISPDPYSPNTSGDTADPCFDFCEPKDVIWENLFGTGSSITYEMVDAAILHGMDRTPDDETNTGGDGTTDPANLPPIDPGCYEYENDHTCMGRGKYWNEHVCECLFDTSVCETDPNIQQCYSGMMFYPLASGTDTASSCICEPEDVIFNELFADKGYNQADMAYVLNEGKDRASTYEADSWWPGCP